MKRPYNSLCSALEADLKEVRKELASLPKGFVGFVASRIQELSNTEIKKRSTVLHNVNASLEKIRAKAESALNTLNSSAGINSDESVWQERLVDIVLEVDKLLVEARGELDPTNHSDKSLGIAQIANSGLPRKLNLKVEEVHEGSPQDTLDALRKLFEQGILSEQEYKEKIKKVEDS